MPRLLLAAALPLLVSCDAWQAQWSARRTCEQGLTRILLAEERMKQPSLTVQERRQIRGDLLEGLLQIRVGLADNVAPGLFFHPEPYHEAERRAAFTMADSRLQEGKPR